ncbi:MAG: cobalt transporter [Alphaproteobacteria bacterium]|nr:MAG: cobalt transporter [Alphaproteobacteria bacterium]
MHIEPGVVTGAKIALSYATAAGAGLYAARLALREARERGLGSLLGRAALTTAAVFTFFEILPHYPVGVSEVHLILGSSLFLIFGAAPAAIGLALGLLIQGLFFAPFDLPQYGMNVTTLLVPLFGLAALARRIIPAGTAYVDLEYRHTLALSLTYQAGIVSWVVFWVIYGQGLAAGTDLVTFAAAYMSVVLLEPVIDLTLLAGAKAIRGLRDSALVTRRLYAPATA